MKSREKSRAKNRVAWPHMFDYTQLRDQMLKEKSSCLATHVRLHSTSRSNVEGKIESFGQGLRVSHGRRSANTQSALNSIRVFEAVSNFTKREN